MTQVDILRTNVGGFFQKVRFVSKKNYSKSLSWAWNLNKLFTVMGGNFKFQVQDSDLEYFLEIWRFEKTNRTFWKKPPMNDPFGSKQKRLFLTLRTKSKLWLDIPWFSSAFRNKTIFLAQILLLFQPEKISKEILELF